MLKRSAIAVLAAAWTAFPAPADEFVDRVNATYATIRPAKRSDTILLPALVGLQEPPAAVSTLTQAMLLPATGASWSAAREWAEAPSQRAALGALAAATADDGSGLFMAFGQPYGVDGVAPALIRAGLYTELGDPPVLSAAQFLYLPSLDRLAILANVEATRLAAAGEPAAAIDGLVGLLSLARQMADRTFYREMDWGLRTMIATLARIRDVAYSDFRSDSPALDAEWVKALIDRLVEDAGPVRVERVVWPTADRIAAEQVRTRVFENRGGPRPEFASVMARIGATGDPLRLFPETAKWQQVADSGRLNEAWFDAGEQIARVFGDWESRWKLSAFDSRMNEPWAAARLDPVKDAMVAAVIPPDADDLFDHRQALRAEAVGTRTALGLLSFYYRNRGFPPALAAIRPTFVPRLEADPYNPRRDRGAQPPMEYFVPAGPTNRNGVNARPVPERQEPRPHLINVVTLDGRNFDIGVSEDQFVVYSVGPDGSKDYADNVREDPRVLFVGDYLVWPPVISLYRQHLVERGDLR